MKRIPLSAVSLAVVGFCAWQASDLLDAWRFSPFDRLGWLAFIIWTLPMFLHASTGSPLSLRREGNAAFQASALAVALLGALGSLNAICYIGLAFSIAGLCAWGTRTAIWLGGAIAWMPVLGYGLSQSLPDTVSEKAFVICTIRLITAVAVSAGITCYPITKKRQLQ